MTGRSYTYKLFARNDFSAFWALFTDNLINLIVLSGICQFVFQMPAEIVFGRIVPGAAVAILAGIAVYTWMAKHIAEKEGRDVTALPYGISTPVMFVYLFGVIGPIYWSTNDAMLAWQVGIGAGFMGAGIATVSAQAGIEVVLIDVNQEGADKGKAHVAAHFAKGVKRGKLTQEKADAKTNLVTATTDYSLLKDVDLVVEAVDIREVERTATGIAGLDKLMALFDPAGLEAGSYQFEISLRDLESGEVHTNSTPITIRN